MKRYIFFLSFIFVLISCNQQKAYYKESGTVFHTYYDIQYEASGLLTEEIESEFKAFNFSLNPFNPNSILAKVNRNEDVETDEWFDTVFNKAQEVASYSDGAFDPTAAPYINLWGFGFEKKDSISVSTIDSLKEFVGYDKVRLNNNKVIKDDPRVMLTFSAIAKGYACDVIAALLESKGVNNYMVVIGGEVTVKGKNPNGRCWHIGINKPEDDNTMMKNDIKEIVALCNPSGLATSGNYRNFYVKDGKKYAHTINPRTGYPSEVNMLSATVVAQDCMTADAYATAFMTLGLDGALALANKHPELEYYFIYTDESDQTKVEMSDGMREFITVKN